MTVAPARCGTEAGYRRHRRLGTEVCAPCREGHRLDNAWRDYRAGRRKAPPETARGQEAQPCGTDAAYQRHIKRGQPVCEPCQLAARRLSLDNQRKIRSDPVRRERVLRLGREKRAARRDPPRPFKPYYTASELAIIAGIELATVCRWEDEWLAPDALGEPGRRATSPAPRRLYDRAAVDMVCEVVDVMRQYGVNASVALTWMTEAVTIDEARAVVRAERLRLPVDPRTPTSTAPVGSTPMPPT